MPLRELRAWTVGALLLGGAHAAAQERWDLRAEAWPSELRVKDPLDGTVLAGPSALGGQLGFERRFPGWSVGWSVGGWGSEVTVFPDKTVSTPQQGTEPGIAFERVALFTTSVGAEARLPEPRRWTPVGRLEVGGAVASERQLELVGELSLQRVALPPRTALAGFVGLEAGLELRAFDGAWVGLGLAGRRFWGAHLLWQVAIPLWVRWAW